MKQLEIMGRKLGHSHTHNVAPGLAEDMYEAMIQQREGEDKMQSGGGWWLVAVKQQESSGSGRRGSRAEDAD